MLARTHGCAPPLLKAVGEFDSLCGLIFLFFRGFTASSTSFKIYLFVNGVWRAVHGSTLSCPLLDLQPAQSSRIHLDFIQISSRFQPDF